MFVRFVLLSLLLSSVASASDNDASIYSNNQWIALPKSSPPNYPAPQPNEWKSSTTEIFITMENFLDSDRCSKSLQSFISHAKYPQRLKFGSHPITPTPAHLSVSLFLSLSLSIYL
jgi:hypothetical protein